MDSFEDLKNLNGNPPNAPTPIYEQPRTHKRNKSCLECITCCQSMESDLSQPQLHLFYTLKPFCNELYDENNESHKSRLLEIYFLYFGKSLETQNIDSEDWMTLGFQGKNAQTDFRGAGILGLENIRCFIINQKSLVEEMSQKSQEFLFAMTSLNISFHLKVFFHLADYLTYDKDKKLICSREALKNFGRVLENSLKLNLKKELTVIDVARNVMYEIHEILLIYCYKKWIHLRKIRKNFTFMEFYKVVEEMKRLLIDIFNYDEMGSIPQLRDFFQKILGQTEEMDLKSQDNL